MKSVWYEIKIPDSTSPEEVDLLLRDAISSFCKNRTPLYEYVMDNYPWMVGERRTQKMLQVGERKSLAFVIENSLTHLKEEPC
jgi:hypothetical protein